MRPKLDFWYEFASTYSYLAALRIEGLAKERKVDIAWRPFLLGPVFKAQGWNTSPFNLFPAKGSYMWRDLQRLCDAQGLEFHRPDPFPQSSLLAARIALTDQLVTRRAEYSRRVFLAEFAQGARIDDEAVLARILRSLDLDDRGILDAARSDKVKLRLRRATDEAMSLQLFGAPSFVTSDGEIFWGNDRLEMALDWAARGGKGVS
ncbi:2-hydroxychromene-2-carboxylate isomerase [Nordella sp. HKS 07]|uniref:2-hydroxychromene-2-carboxylate isomerase n=1 Tax=Nordella sp. HKS 07 TaxID=2712222 RepID=UPI0013E126FB|nr:2-hydroxychromene-2-carboxylate isomerase [Nordella sp. HKS 07]QIG48084.1 2-hydroxychromene-2-carboxylate isomerase [Nordella sp. HKS 07]